jgi:hypothetical protein
MNRVTYRKVAEQEYDATIDGLTLRVRSTWRRSTGHGWETPQVRNGVLPAFALTRDAAVRHAARLVKNGTPVR